MRRLLFVLAPFIAALALAALFKAGVWPDPVVYLRADIGTLAALACVAVHWLDERRTAQALSALRDEQAEIHRRFLRRLDHELKNPLTAIRAGLANLDSKNGGPVVTSVRSQVDRLARLSADLRKLADLETQDIECETVDLAAVLNEIVDMARDRPEGADRRISLTLPQAPWPLPPVAGDRDLLFLALHNLVDNALKFSRPGDTIEVRAYEDGASVAVEVADTGPGVQEDELPHLGEELYAGVPPAASRGAGWAWRSCGRLRSGTTVRWAFAAGKAGER